MAGNSAEPGRSVTSKIVAILLAFHDGDEHSLTDIARRARLPVSTAHRLLAELTTWGVLERTDGSRFRIGLLIKTLGRRRFPTSILESARRVLEDLVTATRTGARLGILTGTDVAYIEKRCDYRPVTIFTQTPRLPAHATALGKVLLSFAAPEIIDRVLANGLERYTPDTVTDAQRLRQSLASIRLTQVAVSRSELEPGLSGVGVAGVRMGRDAVAALELTVADIHADLPMARSALTLAARGLSRELTATAACGGFPLISAQHLPHMVAPDRRPSPLLTRSLSPRLVLDT